jgi:hypothetical protein
MDSSTNQPMITIGEILEQQSFEGGWVCEDCKNYKGKLICKKNYFISFEGCWTKGCTGLEDKKSED